MLRKRTEGVAEVSEEESKKEVSHNRRDCCEGTAWREQSRSERRQPHDASGHQRKIMRKFTGSCLRDGEGRGA